MSQYRGVIILRYYDIMILRWGRNERETSNFIFNSPISLEKRNNLYSILPYNSSLL